MSTLLSKATGQFRFYTAAIALAALVITVLAVNFSASPTQAQSETNSYDDPVPCGPGPNTDEAFQPEPHEVTTGHFALFDSYWEWTQRATNGDPPKTNEGIMHTNECPPLMVPSEEEGATRTASGIDIDEAIFHVLDKHKATVVATNAEVTEDGGELSLEEYEDVREALGLGETEPVPDGTKVWWLRLDDPDTLDDPNTEKIENYETSDLGMGFSAALFDSKYWYREDDEGNPLKAMRYMFELKRYPGSEPDEIPHFLTFEAPKRASKTGPNEKRVVRVWDSTRVHIEPMELDPGEYRPVQWVFTRPGTYVLEVHLQGFVRTEPPPPDHDDYDPNWKRIDSSDVSKTGEVKRYVFQVGDQLEETEPPLFGVNLSVAENSPGGTKVGGPVPVYNADAEILYYDLDGEGKENFKTVAGTDPHTVQIVVADGASLDYETRASYDLALNVTDGVDHENNPDPTVDDTLAVKIDLDAVAPAVSMWFSNPNPRVGDTVEVTMKLSDLPAGASRDTLTFHLTRQDESGYQVTELATTNTQTLTGTISTTENVAQTMKYWATASFLIGGSQSSSLWTDPVSVTWTDQ